MNRNLARENDNIREMLNFLSMPASNAQELKWIQIHEMSGKNRQLT